MFTQLRNTIIQGGRFVQTSVPPTPEGFKILHANIATGAFHDSGERFDAPKYHPNTRTAVLVEIMKGIQNVEELEHVLWLYGSAGAGKSPIVQTIAEMCAKVGFSSPVSSFLAAVQSDPAVFDKSLDTQIEMLIIRPLENACAVVDPTVMKKWPRLIVIDGLDECHGPLIQSFIIRVLSTALLRIPVPLILLIASHDSYEPDANIKIFLLSRFEKIKENHPLAVYIPKSWPSAGIIDQLVRKSSGQFIYASTVMKYLDSPNHRPMKLLDVIIGLIPVDGDMSYKALLLTPYFVGDLLGADEEDVHLCLPEFHSIPYIPPPKTSGLPIKMIHASLQDFLLDRLRSGRHYVDEETIHADLAQQCLRQVIGIKRPDAKLFMSLTEDVASQQEILVPYYRQGLDAVTRLLLKAAPLTDLYICLRDHPLQDPAKAKVHCEHGFASLRLAVKAYLDKRQHLGSKVSEVQLDMKTTSMIRHKPMSDFIDTITSKPLEVLKKGLKILQAQLKAKKEKLQGEKKSIFASLRDVPRVLDALEGASNYERG
ncbi:hypothetical protein BYT27DRAFT_7254737 [Phlegmacium glaucopus]|nr:hypothetical protein BYT27DRAFT_7254737 [Phlegmacium glaucopus]